MMWWWFHSGEEATRSTTSKKASTVGINRFPFSPIAGSVSCRSQLWGSSALRFLRTEGRLSAQIFPPSLRPAERPEAASASDSKAAHCVATLQRQTLHPDKPGMTPQQKAESESRGQRFRAGQREPAFDLGRRAECMVDTSPRADSNPRDIDRADERSCRNACCALGNGHRKAE
jgi:hypothetical protein